MGAICKMKGWRYEGYRHSLAAKGIKTNLYSKRNNFAEGWLSRAAAKGFKKGEEDFRKRYKLPETATFKPEALKALEPVPTELARFPEVEAEARRREKSITLTSDEEKLQDFFESSEKLDRMWKNKLGPEYVADPRDPFNKGILMSDLLLLNAQKEELDRAIRKSKIEELRGNKPKVEVSTIFSEPQSAELQKQEEEKKEGEE